MSKVIKNKHIIKILTCLVFVFASIQVSAHVLGPTSPGKWGPPIMGTGATVSWSLMGSGLDNDGDSSVALSSFMPAGFKAALIAAFDAWSAVANLTFIEVTDPGVGWQASGAEASNIRIAGHTFDGAGGTLAHGYYPPLNGGAAAGDIHFDKAETWKLGFGGVGFDIFTVMAHELGHALGLDHTTFPESLMNPFYTEVFYGPQSDDIAGMQFIYGQAASVPEPQTILLLILAIALLAFSNKKNKRFSLK